MAAERHSILYVDDEQQNLLVFEAAFEEDYQVHLASSAREAIGILRRSRVDVIITDQRMPEMTGVQLLEAVGPEYPDAILMVLTGFSDVEAIIKAINTGRVFQYVTKPWDYAALKITINRALDLQRSELENRALVQELEKQMRREKEIRETFQRYVPEAVVQQVLAGSERALTTGGEARIVTVMFANIAGFRELVSRLTPSQVMEFLNRYYGLMSRIIVEHKGTVGEFVADGILAFFGAPLSSLANDENAVEAALAMTAAIPTFSREYAEPSIGQRVEIGIGVNRGEAIAGYIGSPNRMKYGVIGDVVNVASRIQGRTGGGNRVLIGSSVKEWLFDGFELRPLGPTALRGRDEPIELFEVIGRGGSQASGGS